MRFLFTTLVTLLVLMMYFVDQPEQWSTLRSAAEAKIREALFHQEIRITGLRLVPEERIRASLPSGQSNLWWLANLPVVEARLGANGLVVKARAERCGFRCFEIAIEERQPAFFALVGERVWLVGEDGGVIRPMTRDKLARYVEDDKSESGEGLRIPVVTGLLPDEASSDVVRARFLRLRRSIQILEDVLELRVRNVEFLDNREILVRFFEQPYTARFDLSSQESEELLRDRALRLKSLLRDAGAARERISSVDLGFERIAVVKMN